MCGLHILSTVQLITLGLRGQFRIGICLREHPAGIWCKNDVVLTLMRRDDDVIFAPNARWAVSHWKWTKKNYFRQKVENSMVALNEVFKYFCEG